MMICKAGNWPQYRGSYGGHDLVSSEPLPGCVPDPSLDRGSLPTLEMPPELQWQQAGSIWTADGTLSVEIAHGADAIVLNVANLITVRVWPTKMKAIFSTAENVSDEQLLCLLVGPVLMLLLALCKHFVLHASAIQTDRGAVLLCGESGVGKSTLARSFDAALADDLSCVPCSEGPMLAGAVPQLKWNPSYKQFIPLPVQAIFFLKPGNPARPRTRRLTSRDTALRLCRHTVASRLFPSHLLKTHLRWSAEMASGIQAFELEYRQLRDQIPAMKARILAS